MACVSRGAQSRWANISSELNRRATAMARHRRVNFIDDRKHFEWSPSDGAVGDEIIGPDVVCGLRPQPDKQPSWSHSRLRLGCFAGTLSLARRQMRCTRLALTRQPSVRSSAVMRR